MKRLFLVLELAFTLFIAGCVDETFQIPSGIYSSSDFDNEEKVEVQGSEIVFHVKINGVFWDRQFSSHSLLSDGTIVLRPISSNEYFFLHNQYEWTFDGKEILKEEVETKKIVRFVKENGTRERAEPEN